MIPREARRAVTLPLRELGSFRNGVNFSKESRGNKVKLINVKDIFGDSPLINFPRLDEVEIGEVRDLSRYKAQENDLFFVRSSVKRDGVGLVRLSNTFSRGAVHCGFVIRFRPTSELADSRYLTYLLRSPEYREKIKNLSGGAAITNISQDSLGQLDVVLPDIDVQHRIASILSAYDDLIENNTRRIAILEEMARRIYEEWFVHFRFPGHEQVKMVESELGLIPEGWKVKTVADFGKVVTGKTPSKSDPENFGDDVPFIKTPDMHGNLFCTSTGESLSAQGAESQKGKTLPANSLCVSCIGTAGVVSITTRPAQTNQQINAVVLNEQRNREFLYFALVGLRETINLYGANGATMVNLNKSKFEGLKIVYGDSSTVDHYHAVASPIFQEILVLQKKNANLRTTRDLLLPKLISGELDVSNLPEVARLRAPEEAIAA